MSRIVRIIGRWTVWLVCASSLPAQAHDLWLEKTGKHFVLYQGHRHSAHAGAETLPYDKQFVTGAQCLDARAALRPLTVIATAPWSATGDCAALIIDVSSGYWSKTPWETKTNCSCRSSLIANRSRMPRWPITVNRAALPTQRGASRSDCVMAGSS